MLKGQKAQYRASSTQSHFKPSRNSFSYALGGVGTAREFIYNVHESIKAGILIVSSGVTDRTKGLIERHNKTTDNKKAFLVVGDSDLKINNEFNKIFRKSLRWPDSQK